MLKNETNNKQVEKDILYMARKLIGYQSKLHVFFNENLSLTLKDKHAIKIA